MLSYSMWFMGSSRNREGGGNPAFEPLLIINPFSGQFLANLFATHPSTEARVENLLKIEQGLSSTSSEWRSPTS